jgi:hypothetical protein
MSHPLDWLVDVERKLELESQLREAEKAQPRDERLIARLRHAIRAVELADWIVESDKEYGHENGNS